MSGNLPYVVFLVFVLIFIRMMFQAYDDFYYWSEVNKYNWNDYDENRIYTNSTISEDIGYNESLTYSDNKIFGFSNFWGFITGIKYSSANIPWYITALIYIPILIGIIYLLIPTFK